MDGKLPVAPTWDGTIVDDASAKVGCLRFYDGTVLSAYTGLAKWGAFETRRWIRDTLYDHAKPWTKTMEALSLLRAGITDEFITNSEIAALPAKDRKLSLVFAGYVDGNFLTVLISNFQGKDGSFPEVANQFTLTTFNATDSSGNFSGYYGALSTVDQEDLEDLSDILSKQKDALAAKGKCLAIILKAGPKSSGSVGPNILTPTLYQSGATSSWYSTQNDEDQTLNRTTFMLWPLMVSLSPSIT